MLFRKIIHYALLIGVLSGLVVTVVQSWQVIPIIQSAELFENQVVMPGSTHAESTTQGHSHSAQLWAPEDGMERKTYTLLANIFVAIGFSMMLLVIMIFTLRTKVITKFSWGHGLLFGAAGYSVFFLAPSFGLPPEIPLATVAPVEARQLWWLFVVLSTSAGLAGLVFIKSPWRWLAIILLVVPHLVTPPRVSGAMFADQPAAVAAKLEQLAQQFIGATAITNAVLWLILGILSAWAIQRIMTSLKGEIFN